jgi:phage shock protein A
MAIFERIADVLKANINDMIDRAEDPEKMVKQLILEMEEQGYDMTAYKLDYGLITEEEADAIEAEKAKEKGEQIMRDAVEKDRRMVQSCGTT